MTTLVKMRFGAHLFGTNTPSSDLDEKSVVVPCARTLLLGAPILSALEHLKSEGASPSTPSKTEDSSSQGSSSQGSSKRRAKRRPFEIDGEEIPVAKFMIKAAEGQTNHIDMLFAPASMYLAEPHPLWLELRANRAKLVTRKAGGFVAMARTQAVRYAVKVERFAVAKAAEQMLAKAIAMHGPVTKLGTIRDEIDFFVALHDPEHTGLETIRQANGTDLVHFVVCGRKVALTASLKTAHDIVAGVVADYGARARAAATNDGIDWKSLSHAVRVAHEAIELLSTGHITLPRPEAAELLAIKQGLRPYDAVARELDALVARAEAAQKTSNLPDAPDLGFVEAFVMKAHRLQIEGRL